jgi:hypothetical protein
MSDGQSECETSDELWLVLARPPKIDLVECVGIHTLRTIPAHANA